MVSLGVRSGLCFLRGATSEHVPAKLGYNVRSLKQIYESFFTLGGRRVNPPTEQTPQPNTPSISL